VAHHGADPDRSVRTTGSRALASATLLGLAAWWGREEMVEWLVGEGGADVGSGGGVAGVLYEEEVGGEEEEGEEGCLGGLTLLGMALAGRRFDGDGDGEGGCPVRMVLCLLGNGADRRGLLEGMERWYRCGAHGNGCATEVFRWLVRAEPRAAAEEEYSDDEGGSGDEGSDDEGSDDEGSDDEGSSGEEGSDDDSDEGDSNDEDSGYEGHTGDEGSDDEDSGFDTDSEGYFDDESDSLAGSDLDGPSMAFCPRRAADFALAHIARPIAALRVLLPAIPLNRPTLHPLARCVRTLTVQHSDNGTLNPGLVDAFWYLMWRGDNNTTSQAGTGWQEVVAHACFLLARWRIEDKNDPAAGTRYEMLKLLLNVTGIHPDTTSVSPPPLLVEVQNLTANCDVDLRFMEELLRHKAHPHFRWENAFGNTMPSPWEVALQRRLSSRVWRMLRDYAWLSRIEERP
jgi:hypothetical protein